MLYSVCLCISKQAVCSANNYIRPASPLNSRKTGGIPANKYIRTASPISIVIGRITLFHGKVNPFHENTLTSEFFKALCILTRNFIPFQKICQLFQKQIRNLSLKTSFFQLENHGTCYLPSCPHSEFFATISSVWRMDSHGGI